MFFWQTCPLSGHLRGYIQFFPLTGHQKGYLSNSVPFHGTKKRSLLKFVHIHGIKIGILSNLYHLGSACWNFVYFNGTKEDCCVSLTCIAFCQICPLTGHRRGHFVKFRTSTCHLKEGILSNSVHINLIKMGSLSSCVCLQSTKKGTVSYLSIYWASEGILWISILSTFDRADNRLFVRYT